MKCKHCGEELKKRFRETIYHYNNGTTEIVYFCDLHCYFQHENADYDPFGEPRGYWTTSKPIKIEEE